MDRSESALRRRGPAGGEAGAGGRRAPGSDPRRDRPCGDLCLPRFPALAGIRLLRRRVVPCPQSRRANDCGKRCGRRWCRSCGGGRRERRRGTPRSGTSGSRRQSCPCTGSRRSAPKLRSGGARRRRCGSGRNRPERGEPRRSGHLYLTANNRRDGRRAGPRPPPSPQSRRRIGCWGRGHGALGGDCCCGLDRRPAGRGTRHRRGPARRISGDCDCQRKRIQHVCAACFSSTCDRLGAEPDHRRRSTRRGRGFRGRHLDTARPRRTVRDHRRQQRQCSHRAAHGSSHSHSRAPRWGAARSARRNGGSGAKRLLLSRWFKGRRSQG